MSEVHRQGLTDSEWRALIEGIAEGCRQMIKDALNPLETRIAQLELHGIQYWGVYQRAAEYKRGDVVSHNGTMWVAITGVPPNENPGVSALWVLADKSQQPRKATHSRTQHSNG